MSQVSTMAGDGQSHAAKAPTGRAVLLLAVAVVLGIALLHELDDTTASISGEQAAQQSTQDQQSAMQSVQSTTSTVPLRTPADIKILVANGTNVNGAAAKVASRLQPVGYQLLKPGNTTRNDYTASGVQFAEGFQTEAQAVATALGIPATSVQPIPSPAPLTDLQAANILVVVGNDLASSAATQQSTSQQQSATLNNALNGPLTQGNNSTTTVVGGTSNGTSAQSTSGAGSVTTSTTIQAR